MTEIILNPLSRTLPDFGYSKKYKNRQVWKDKEGKKYKLKDITDQHLLNIIPFLRKKAEVFFGYFPTLNGTFAQESAESDFYQELDKLNNAIGFFKEVAKERGLIKGERVIQKESNWGKILNSRFSDKEDPILELLQEEEF